MGGRRRGGRRIGGRRRGGWWSSAASPQQSGKRGNKTERLFWQSGGGFDRNVIKPGTRMKMIDYIHMNPVRRGLVENPEPWKWSSAVWYLGAGAVPICVDPIPMEWLDDSS